MSAYNDRRSGKDRREGDRRWLGSFREFVEHEYEHPATGKRRMERRMGGDRRVRQNPLSNLAY